MKQYHVGVDIGTTSMKGALYNESMECVKRVSFTYRKEDNRTQQTTQDPYEILRVFDSVIETLSTDYPITSITLSCAMHSMMLVDRYGNLLTDLILWNDTRANEVIESAKKNIDWISLYQMSGTPFHPMSPLAKLLWFKKERPDLYQSIGRVYDLKSWLMDRYTGNYVLDYSLASATGLMSLETLSWNHDLLNDLALSEEQLPVLVDVVAKYSFLESEIILCIGASDGCLANFGSQLESKEIPLLTMGTSGAFRMMRKTKVFNSDIQSFCYYLNKEYWVVGAPVNNCGNVLEWLSQLLYRTSDVEIMLNEHFFEIGVSPVRFKPFLFGERAPYWDASLLASFDQLSYQTTHKDLVQAVLEGILFNLFSVYEALYPTAPKALRISGGLLEHSKIAQMVADVLGCELIVLDQQESGCFGAVCLYLEKQFYAQEVMRYIPDGNLHIRYNERYHEWKQWLKREMMSEKVALL